MCTHQQPVGGAASGTPSKSAAKKGGDVYGEFWEMPSRFWKPRAMVMEEAEIDAITVSHAIPPVVTACSWTS